MPATRAELIDAAMMGWLRGAASVLSPGRPPAEEGDQPVAELIDPSIPLDLKQDIPVATGVTITPEVKESFHPVDPGEDTPLKPSEAEITLKIAF